MRGNILASSLLKRRSEIEPLAIRLVGRQRKRGGCIKVMGRR
jgi:hypothetical protein